ncbi:hypothetical protein [Erythrobacter dokdonensis]|uniref:Uncharacterized protein n=1 Tax=Erythrobacter dokdonensis DSW-74 TaxID=1300349 RepID=A0A1A7BIZ9_9SPHN|nr:hypothetical protein [Erythrobacter dokdonensis]OBV12449.1 hypothetical protein I603_0580 [Erythrobacter dokdonensis DSW-74]
MADHPSTFKGDTGDTGAIAWDDRASLHAADEAMVLASRPDFPAKGEA